MKPPNERIIWQCGDLVMSMTAARTLFRVGGEYLDVVRHQPRHCHLCGFRFIEDYPESKVKHWCADCYERFICNGGRYVIANVLEWQAYRRTGASPFADVISVL